MDHEFDGLLPSLPPELLTLIGSYLPIKHLPSFLLVSRVFGQLSDSNEFWHSICVRYPPETLAKIDDGAVADYRLRLKLSMKRWRRWARPGTVLVVEPREENPQQYLCRFILIGDSGIGKTSFMVRYIEGEFAANQVTTIGLDFRNKTFGKGELGSWCDFPTTVQIWDTASEERFSPTRMYARNGTGFFLCYDVSSRYSFESLRVYAEMLWQGITGESPETFRVRNGLHGDRTERIGKMNVLLMGMKCDLEHEVSTSEGEALAAEYGWDFIETSSLRNENVQEAVVMMVRRSLSSFVFLNPEMEDRLMHRMNFPPPARTPWWSRCEVM